MAFNNPESGREISGINGTKNFKIDIDTNIVLDSDSENELSNNKTSVFEFELPQTSKSSCTNAFFTSKKKAESEDDSRTPLLDENSSHSSNTDNKSEASERQSLFKAIRDMDRSKKLTILSCGIVKFTVATFYGLLAPFYPIEATNKGATPFWIGVVFGIFQATIGLASPVLGSFITEIGARRMYASGITVCGISGIAFAFINSIEDCPTFIGISVLVRAVEAVGAAAFYVSSYSILAFVFPENAALILGSLELFAGLGLMNGPVIGGALYQLGGFKLPFLVIGGIICVIGVASMFILPNHDVRLPPREGSIWGLLKIPLVNLLGLCLITGFSSIGFKDVLLGVFLKRQYQLTEVLVGLMFLTCSGMYAISAPCWGHLSDKLPHRTSIIVALGFGVAGISHVLMGPAPFLHLPHMLWLQIVSGLLMGTGLGTFVLVFNLFSKAAVSRGYPENLATHGLAAGLVNGFIAIGACGGPFVGGLLQEKYSFETAVAIVGISEIFSAALLAIHILFGSCISCNRNIKSSELKDPNSNVRDFKESNIESEKIGLISDSKR